jgi:hypothetical protein
MPCDASNGSIVEHDLLVNVDDTCLIMANKIGNLDESNVCWYLEVHTHRDARKCIYWISQSLMEISYM